MERPEYLKWLVKEAVILDNGKPVNCYVVNYNNDIAVLDDWALHIRRHYISDEELKQDCAELTIAPEEYLKENIIPQKNDEMGPTARSNTISEILFSDLFEFVYGYTVPRCRQYNIQQQ